MTSSLFTSRRIPTPEPLALPPSLFEGEESTLPAPADAKAMASLRRRATWGRRWQRFCGAMTWAWMFLWALVPWAVGLGMVGGIGYGGYFALLESTYFDVVEIRIHGAKSSTRDELLALSGLGGGRRTNLLLMSGEELSSRIATHPRVRWAEVQKVYPGMVQIQVEERVPFAILATSPMFLVDRDGVAMDELGAASFKDLPPLPFISGIPGTAVTLGQPIASPLVAPLMRIWQTLAQAAPGIASRLAELHVAEDGDGLVFVMNQGTRLVLGQAPGPRELAQLEALDEQAGPLEKYLRVDLRFHRQVVALPPPPPTPPPPEKKRKP